MQTADERSGPGVSVVREPLPDVRQQIHDPAPTGATSVEIALLTGGQDRHYAVGLATALMRCGFTLDIIGSDEIDGPEFQDNPRARFRNLHGSQQSANLLRRISRILRFYAKLFRYTLTSKARIFHILWNNKFPVFDRTLLMLFYKSAGKKVVFTAHNVNAGRRDGNDSWLNRLTLSCQYRLADQIFVHTSKMKDELIDQFQAKENKVSIIPYGINNAVPISELTREEARHKLGLWQTEKVILYFGAIKLYKGIEHLVAAFQQIAATGEYRLVIAGERKKGHEEYWQSIQQSIELGPCPGKVLQKIEFIPDSEVEIYFKAADVAVLPYSEIFQSGILFLTYAYGVPVIATDVGSFSEDVIEGKTGFLCEPANSQDLANTIRRYFNTDLYRDLAQRRQEIRAFAISRHSWDTVADITTGVYAKTVEKR